MKIHLFGLPKSAHNRLRYESGSWANAVPAPHEFRSTPILSNDLGNLRQSDIEELAKAVGEGFTHVILAAVRNWREISSRLQFDCRMHIARLAEPVRDVTWPVIQSYIQAAIALDQIWLEKFCPRDLRHALLLPPSVFATNRSTAKYWEQCDVYSQERFAIAERLLVDVERHHRRPDEQGGRSWLDERRRRFRVDLARHARSQADRAHLKSFRFCFEVPPGFHYDVSDDLGKTFVVEIDGRSERVQHCNISPWGHVRAG